jgi:hypothetical protein
MIDKICNTIQHEEWIIKKYNENVPTLEEFLSTNPKIDDQAYFTGNDVVVCNAQASRELKSYLVSDLFSNKYFQLSGPFFFYPPMCGRGWHTNQTCLDTSINTTFRCYSIRTTGGTFFFYKHPESGEIHAVHDVDRTVNIFNLYPMLWHAVGSFTGYRFSVGFMCSQNVLYKFGVK